ncbi:hypothetical protein [Agrococcus casei]|uniref:hypothetical protein n=1 Tax=Agrococcus casei TaxID=343512 RepID=UPI003F92FE2E
MAGASKTGYFRLERTVSRETAFEPTALEHRRKHFSGARTLFGIFDVFPDDAGRDAHLSGAVAAALGEQTGKLFSEPTIEKLDVLASKLAA